MRCCFLTFTLAISIGGKTSLPQPELIRSAVARMPVGSETLTEGRKPASVMRLSVHLLGATNCGFPTTSPVRI
jgi:hypothetical protein